MILKKAEALNYFPNHIARSLSSKSTRTVGLILTDILNPTQTLAARTIEEELNASGYGTMFVNSDGDVEMEKRALRQLQSYQVDGLVIYPAKRSKIAHVEAVAGGGTPILSLVQLPGSALDIVTIDDSIGGYAAAHHLVSRGHRRIAIIDGGQAVGNLDKQEGAVRACFEAGLAQEDVSIHEPDGNSATLGYATMAKIMGAATPPTAVFASTDSLAIGAMHWCREHGIAIPEDMAIVGYDNTDGAPFTCPPLTTVNYAADEISRIGVRKLLERIADPDIGPSTRLIQPELIVRGSS